MAFFTFQLVVNLERTLADQEQAAADQDQSPPRDLMSDRAEERRRQLDDPGQREQQRDTRQHRAEQPDAPRPRLLRRRQLSGQDRDEDDVVYAEHDLEEG